MESIVYCGYIVFDEQYYFTSNSQIYYMKFTERSENARNKSTLFLIVFRLTVLLWVLNFQVFFFFFGFGSRFAIVTTAI